MAYYDTRAPEYEEMFRRDDPVRQAELRALGQALLDALRGRRVLEVACGTGYWTALLAGAARSILALDAAPKMLAIAREKALPSAAVTLRLADAYRLAEVSGVCDAGLANFWLSHVPRNRLDAWLEQFHARIGRGAPVFMADNVFFPGVGGELVRREGCADTYKRRVLADGSTYDVLKNYFNESELRGLLARHADALSIYSGTCYWWVSYRVA